MVTRPQVCSRHSTLNTQHSIASLDGMPSYELLSLLRGNVTSLLGWTDAEYFYVSRWTALIGVRKCSQMFTHSSQLAVVAIPPFFYAAEANLLIGNDVSSPYWFISSFLGILSSNEWWKKDPTCSVFYFIILWTKTDRHFVQNLCGSRMIAIPKVIKHSHKISFRRQS
jgi:hypothetical protein